MNELETRQSSDTHLLPIDLVSALLYDNFMHDESDIPDYMRIWAHRPGSHMRPPGGGKKLEIEILSASTKAEKHLQQETP